LVLIETGTDDSDAVAIGKTYLKFYGELLDALLTDARSNAANQDAYFWPLLEVVCGRLRVGKSFFHVCSSIGRCSHVFGL